VTVTGRLELHFYTCEHNQVCNCSVEKRIDQWRGSGNENATVERTK